MSASGADLLDVLSDGGLCPSDLILCGAPEFTKNFYGGMRGIGQR